MVTAILIVVALGILAFVGAFDRIVKRIVDWRLGPARVRIEGPNESLPATVGAPRKAAVIGGGLAGISAATSLAERGVTVTLFEAEEYLGGKIGCWSVDLPDGSSAWIGHGYHAFFAHYYNLNRYLDRLGLRESFRTVGDYTIVELDGGTLSFEGIDTTPILNLLSLHQRGVYSLAEIVFGPARDLMGIFLEYDERVTFERLDDVSFAAFARDARLPKRLRLAFGTFARAFFASEEKMSLAQLVKCFHFYFLGHDGGLVYDYPHGDYETKLLAPIREDLRRLGVDLRLGTRVESLVSRDGAFEVEGEVFDDVIVATNVVGARRIMKAAKGVDAPLFEQLRPGQRYAVLRLWIDRPFERDLPVFVITERRLVLDAVAFVDRIESNAENWAKTHNGAVLELHCYAVPDELDESAIEAGLFEELVALFDELEGARIRMADLQLKRDFPAFHVGSHRTRPAVDAAVEGLYFAGDWVKLDFPSMLMEGAFTSGLVAANRVLARAGVQQVLVESVPLRGVMASMPWPPAREAWVARAVHPIQ